MPRLYYVCALFLVLAGVDVAAAEERLSLDAVVREVLAKSPGAIAVRAAPVVAEAERAVAALAFPDGLELSLGAATDALGTRDGELALDAGLALDLGGPLRRGLRVAAAAALVESANAEASRALATLAAQAAHAWVSLYSAERRLSIAVERSDVTRELATAVEARFARGDASELERLAASLEVARADGQAALAEGAAGAAAELLLAVLGRAPGAPLRTEPPPPLPALAASAGAMVAGGLSTRADIVALDRAALAARARGRLARSAALPWPRLELDASADRTVLEPDDFSGDLDLARRLGPATGVDVLVGLRVSVPLGWTGGPGRAARASLAEAALLEARRAAAERNASGEILAAFRRAAAAEKASTALAAAEVAAARALELLGRAYAAGEVGVLDLLVAKDRAFAARESAVEADTARLTARIDLALAAGRTFPEVP